MVGSTLDQYTDALLEVGYAHIPDPLAASNADLPFQGSVEEHLRLLQICEATFKELIKSPLLRGNSEPTLLHPDLHKRNIYVSADDPTEIRALIDWQSTCIEPAFAYADESPDLILPPPALSSIPEWGEEPESTEDGGEERKRLEKDLLICQQMFEVSMLGFAPKIAAVRAVDATLLRPLRYYHSSWSIGTVALRQDLIELSQRWSELELPGSCPYQPSAEELAEHAKQWEDFETTQKFKLYLMKTLDAGSDGWVPIEAWETSRAVHKQLFEIWMETVRASEDPDMNEDRGRRIWPWDETK